MIDDQAGPIGYQFLFPAPRDIAAREEREQLEPIAHQGARDRLPPFRQVGCMQLHLHQPTQRGIKLLVILYDEDQPSTVMPQSAAPASHAGSDFLPRGRFHFVWPHFAGFVDDHQRMFQRRDYTAFLSLRTRFNAGRLALREIHALEIILRGGLARQPTFMHRFRNENQPVPHFFALALICFPRHVIDNGLNIQRQIRVDTTAVIRQILIHEIASQRPAFPAAWPARAHNDRCTSIQTHDDPQAQQASRAKWPTYHTRASRPGPSKNAGSFTAAR